jgi:putative ABC transport system substrate-binding protein
MKRITATIPIVMANVHDPVGLGFVNSLAQPGGNVTGLATLTVEIGGKNLELLREVLPRLSSLGVLVKPVQSGRTHLRERDRANCLSDRDQGDTP